MLLSEQMWLIVCSIDREYSVVSDKDVLSGNVTCGSRVTIAQKGLRKEVTIIFTNNTRAQCDQYCQRLSRYCSPSESQRAPIDITFLNLPRKRKEPVDEELSENSSTHADSLFDKSQVKEEPSENVRMEVNHEEVKPPSITAAEIMMEQHEPAPSTSSEQDDDEENADVEVEVPHNFFAELLRTMKSLRNECRSRFDRLDDQVEDLAGRVFVLEQSIRRGNGRVGSQNNGAPPNSDAGGAGNTTGKLTENDYPYPGLSKVVVDTIQRESKTITSFARKVDRILFAHDSDKDSSIDARDDKEKVMWLRNLIRTMHPTASDLDDAARWTACRQAINDYCRRSGNHLTEEERVPILRLVATRSHEEAAAEFNRLHPNREPIRQSSVTRLIAKFKATSSIVDRPRSGRPAIETTKKTTSSISDELEQPWGYAGVNPPSLLRTSYLIWSTVTVIM
ncbi:hypothetical protein ANCCAN_07142 [Ancylostoma caninum]|uniref:BEN domain-containing protein n=1 Tax=Ancylostoma caninum TaxID=29170 RepID=A0A368GV31_ANCCA|nr:hypothetical protein ANCCAN_07142 [Ancylostoma caninum]